MNKRKAPTVPVCLVSVKRVCCAMLLGLLFGTAPLRAQHFEPSWASLAQYDVPAWYQDAKFGIFMHWGVPSLAANDGWYARHMYLQEDAPWGNAYAYHVATYGHPSTFGYKDLIPRWRAERWDPDALVRFYRRIGARYVVPVAVHHDNFDLYASAYQPWNAVNMGPKQDIVGRWQRAADRYGLRFGVSSHADRTWDWFAPAHGSDVKGPKQGVPYDGRLTKADGAGTWWEGYDPQDLYGRPHDPGEPPDAAYLETYYNRTKQLIDAYRPDLLYFDGPLPVACPSEACGAARPRLETYGLRLAAHFYNQSQVWHDGRLEAVLNVKSWGPGSVPDSSAVVLDIEKGQADTRLAAYWQTDTSLNDAWYYTPEPLALSDTVVVHNLVDIVSKNGNLLLNVALRADGTLPEDQRRILERVGAWLRQNGEAIYGTRPWRVYGEGPTRVAHGDFAQPRQPLTAQDVRYTTKGNTLYAIVPGWPSGGRVVLRSVTDAAPLWFGDIASVTMLGAAAPLAWHLGPDGLAVALPTERPEDLAYVLRIQGEQLSMADLFAWCIVPYDRLERTPEARIAMLERLGFDRYAYDWRAGHLPEMARELRLARAHGIDVQAVWMWIDAEHDRPGALSEANEQVLAALQEAGVATQVWVGFHANYFDGLGDAEAVARGVEMVRYLSGRAQEADSRVALYNHGGWFGEPENQIRIIEALPGREIGLVYNFHHAHAQLDRFDALVERMRPYLWAVNLNGMRPEGPKILPFGAGTHERHMLRRLRDAGFTGPFGVLGHVAEADVEAVLRENLAGLGILPE